MSHERQRKMVNHGSCNKNARTIICKNKNGRKFSAKTLTATTITRFLIGSENATRMEEIPLQKR
jgi:hypothetical protein